MAIRNTSTSAPCPQESPALTMPPSAVPEGLRLLAWCCENRPSDSFFSVDDLDAIAENENTDIDGEGPDGASIHSALGYINWWLRVAEALTFGRSTKGLIADPAFDEQRAKVLSLLNDTLSSYAAALAENLYYAGAETYQTATYPAHLELFRRYRLYTRHVCGFAREVWPDVELDWLHGQA